MTRFKRVKDTIKPSNIIKALKDHQSNRTFRLAAEKVQPWRDDKKRRSGGPSCFDRNEREKKERELRTEKKKKEKNTK